MNKFKGREDDDAEIEIAKSFSKPNTSFKCNFFFFDLSDYLFE